jgi:natural product precursor
MKKNAKLTLHRETLRHLVSPELRNVAGGAFARAREDASQSIQSGETYCWCTQTCNCCETATQLA